MTRPNEESGSVAGDRYRLLEPLGQGGMGAVYAAEDIATGDLVALKRLEAPGDHLRRLFEREYRTLASVRHPRIVEAYDYGVDDRGAFYTMELLEGQDLTGTAPMPWRNVCLCLRDAASILGVLHARHLVHRDLSPRNLWRCPDGRLKLLDFGALAPFGPAKEVVGTPPLVPPEVLMRKALDARSDLYALGALGYWLLTGAHAFRATNLAELPTLWEQEPPLPSRLLGLMGSEVEPVPDALDRLIMSLLRRDPAERPSSTVEVIDSLSAIADLEAESHDVVVQGYFDSTAFVGRTREQRSFRKRLRRARDGEPHSVLVEGGEGLGKTRLLDELAMWARLDGAVVVRCRGEADERPFGAAADLALALLHAAPVRAKATAAPHASVLAHLSAEVRAALGDVAPEPDLKGASNERMRKQAALAEWFAALSRERPISVFADDAHALDEDSAALLAALSFLGPGHRLLVTAATLPQADPSAPLRALRKRSKRLHPAPLEPEETRKLLRSVFGATQYLDRVAGRLHRLSEGNPRHCLMLAQHLVRTGVARYTEGHWSLPKEVPEAGLPRTVRAGLVATLERLSTDARGLARRLSVPDRGGISLSMCQAVHEGTLPVGALLGELTEAGVLRRSADGFTFAHPALREALLAELDGDVRRGIHRAFGHVLSQKAEVPADRIRAGLHLIRGGDLEAGEALLIPAAHMVLDGHVEQIGAGVDFVEDALSELRAAGRTDLELLIPLGFLCCAGYYHDPRFGERYGPPAVAAFERALQLRWARRLRSVLGGKLALILALIVASVRLRRVRNAGPPRVLVRVMMLVCTTLAGVAATALDPKRARYYADVIEPFTALGKNHIAMLTYRMLKVIALSAEERAGETYEQAVRLRDWLGGGTPITGMTPELRSALLAAAWFMYGIRTAFRDDGSANVAADHMREFGPSYEVNAHQLRTMHHAGRGDTEQATYHRERMGVLAMQQGTGWRAEAFAPTITMPALWAHDAVALKRAAEQLERLTADFPGYAHHARSARAAYHLLRGKPYLAIDLLEAQPDEPLAHAGWARTRSVLAAAYSEVGRYADAARVCRDALSHLSPDDLELLGLNLNVTAELAVAEAGLGEHAAAAERLDAWLAKCADRGPLLLCYLHRKRAQVALLARDVEACQAHLDSSERFARATTTPSPLAAIRHLRHRLTEFTSPHGAAASLLDSSVELTAVVQQMLKSGVTEKEARGDKVLRVAAEVAGASHGYFVLANPGSETLSLRGDAPSDSLLAWARERLADASGGGDDATAALPECAVLDDPNTCSEGGRHYCLKAFWASRSGLGEPLGALVLGFDSRSAQLPAPEVLTVLSTYLTQAALPSHTRTMGRSTDEAGGSTFDEGTEHSVSDGVDETCA